MVSEEFYYCPKCGRRHRYVSKIGMNHLQYNTSSSITSDETTLNQDTITTAPEHENKDLNIGKRINLIEFIRSYRKSYRIGVEKFGIWWTIFQLSIWSIVFILLSIAVIAFVVYLPKIEILLLNL